MLKRFLRVVLILVVGGVITLLIALNPYELPEQAEVIKQPIAVDVQALAPERYTIEVKTYGVLRAHTQVALSSEVAGRVVQVSKSLQSGGYFSAGDTLLKIDDRDYRIAIDEARGPLLSAQSKLSEERARAEQAGIDWKLVEDVDAPSSLVLRQPQLKAARAALFAAEAGLERAQLNLARTHIRAPFDGAVLSRDIQISQHITQGTVLAQIFATDLFEISLPLNSQQLQAIDLPDPRVPKSALHVDLLIERGEDMLVYPGVVKRAAHAFDKNTRQLSLIGQVDIANLPDGLPPLRIEQFAKALIKARTLENVYVIQRGLLLQGNRVLLAADNQTVTRAVQVAWLSDEHAVISGNLMPGELLINQVVGDLPAGTPISYSVP